MGFPEPTWLGMPLARIFLSLMLLLGLILLVRRPFFPSFVILRHHYLSKLLTCTLPRVNYLTQKSVQTIVFILFLEGCPEVITQMPVDLLFRHAISFS